MNTVIFIVSYTIATITSCTPFTRIQRIDKVTATTTIRLWHELHVSKFAAHDFVDLIAPDTASDIFYMGAIRHNEIRAISKCKKERNCWKISKIAHAPDQVDASIELLRILHAKNYKIDWQTIKFQPRCFYESLFIKESILLP